jgi:hypothetical protein
MFLAISGSHTSTFAQTRSTAVPVVPDLELAVSEDSVFDGVRVPLDGFFGRHNQFGNVTFEYGGGAFRLQNCKFDGPIRVSLKGAAANTFVFLQLMQAIEAGRQPQPVVPRKPLEQLVEIKQAVTTQDLISPFGTK